MDTFTINCISLNDACEALNVDPDAAWDALHGSEISFGTNTDTLVSVKRFAEIVGVTAPSDLEHLMVSLGC